jgi:hypothetical protein
LNTTDKVGGSLFVDLFNHQRNTMNVSEESEEEAMFDNMVMMPSLFGVLCTGTAGHRP